MTQHWWFVAMSWGSALGLFGALAIAAMVRHREARRRLAPLERVR